MDGLIFFTRKAVAAVAMFALLPYPATASDKTQYLRAIPVEEPPAPAKEPPATDEVNATARVLAGLPPGGSGPAAALAATGEWRSYAHDMDSAWLRLDMGRMAKIRPWSASQLANVSHPVVFYPFSGPDFAYVFTYFPNAATYILCGLEPVGELPSAAQVRNPRVTLAVLRQSLSTLLDAGYFVTKSMRVDLSAGEARGTLPLLYIQLAREGCRITDVQVGKNQARIEFVAPSGTHRRTLFYYSTDLSNGPFGGGSPFAAAVHGSAPVTTYVKSASYLLHLDDFSRVRNFIMDVSGSIVEDDSGIPLRYLDPRRWQVRLYGNYTPPLNIFKEHYQPDLAAAYGSLRTRSPIDFGVGYKWQPDEACIIVAVAK